MFDRIFFDSEMNGFLYSLSSNKIAILLLNGTGNLICEEGNYVRRETDGEEEMLSYLPKSKYGKVQDEWSQCRTKIKAGKFVRKFLSERSIEKYCITDQDIEKFVNLFKSFFNRDRSRLVVVEGEEIAKYYLESNYMTSAGSMVGTLWNSCMRQRDRNKYLELYSKNPGIRMLVFLSDDGKVRARALLWEEVREHSSDRVFKFMDRIYAVYDHDVNFFKDWAAENGYITKAEQNAKTEQYFDVDGGVKRMSLYVSLEKKALNYYPYLDTFKYFNWGKGRLSNSTEYLYDYTLVQSNGMLEREEPEEEFEDEDN